MNVEEVRKAFLALSGKDQMEVLRGVLPVFCRDMSGDPEKVMVMFTLFTEECGSEMKNMFAMMKGMMSRKSGCCCG